MTTIISGPIDTRSEIEAILNVLRNGSHLKQTAVINAALIDVFLNEIREQRSNQIIGSVDTPREIKILLDILMKHEILSGPIDTPEETKIFMEKLQQAVMSQLCWNTKPAATLNQNNKNRP